MVIIRVAQAIIMGLREQNILLLLAQTRIALEKLCGPWVPRTKRAIILVFRIILHQK